MVDGGELMELYYSVFVLGSDGGWRTADLWLQRSEAENLWWGVVMLGR